MRQFLLIALLLRQNPTLPPQSGAITGILKDRDGKPVQGIRIAAIPRPNTTSESLASSMMSSISETDSQGRFALENIPPGAYYIAAGRLDHMTYFPGTPEVSAAKEVVIAPGQKVTGIDFVLNDSSVGRSISSEDPRIPVVVKVEGDGPLPVSGAGKLTTIKFNSPESVVSLPTTLSDGWAMPLGARAVTVRVSVENLPASYVVKSLTFGSRDLLSSTLDLEPATPLGTQRSVALLPSPAMGGSVVGNFRPYIPLAVTLARSTPERKTGVRVSGHLSGPTTERQTIYLSGIGGDLFSDGTFEVLGVPPGRHSIITKDDFSEAAQFGGVVVIGDRDVENIMLEELALTPAKLWRPPVARLAGNRPAGSVPLAGISGAVVEAVSGEPVSDGAVIVKSNNFYADSFPVEAGRFEIRGLLPGTYDLELQIFGHDTIKRSVEIEDEDLQVDFTTRKIR